MTLVWLKPLKRIFSASEKHIKREGEKHVKREGEKIISFATKRVKGIN